MPVVHYEQQGAVAHLHVDDGKANALSDAMVAELRDALTRAEKEAGAVVLSGRPERFCAGFDLKVMISSPEAAQKLLRTGAELLMRIYGSPLPIVVACTGHALAGGALVLLTGDVRIGAAGAFRIGLNEVAIGMPVPVLAMELARDRIAVPELGRATLRAQIYPPTRPRAWATSTRSWRRGIRRHGPGRGDPTRWPVAHGLPGDEEAPASQDHRSHPVHPGRGHGDHHGRRLTGPGTPAAKRRLHRKASRWSRRAREGVATRAVGS